MFRVYLNEHKLAGDAGLQSDYTAWGEAGLDSTQAVELQCHSM